MAPALLPEYFLSYEAATIDPMTNLIIIPPAQHQVNGKQFPAQSVLTYYINWNRGIPICNIYDELAHTLEWN